MIKLSMGLIKHLEENNQWERFREEFDLLHERDRSYANTVAGVMDLAYNLNRRNEDYLIIGGLAVASYVNQVDHEGFMKWRGTNDIDIIVPDHDLGDLVLRETGYKFTGQVQKKMPGAVGMIRTYTNDGNGAGKNETLVAGLRQGASINKKDKTSKLLQQSSTVDVYSVPIRVPSLRDLIEMKKEANRKKDREDILLLKREYPGISL